MRVNKFVILFWIAAATVPETFPLKMYASENNILSETSPVHVWDDQNVLEHELEALKQNLLEKGWLNFNGRGAVENDGVIVAGQLYYQNVEPKTPIVHAGNYKQCLRYILKILSCKYCDVIMEMNDWLIEFHKFWSTNLENYYSITKNKSLLKALSLQLYEFADKLGGAIKFYRYFENGLDVYPAEKSIAMLKKIFFATENLHVDDFRMPLSESILLYISEKTKEAMDGQCQPLEVVSTGAAKFEALCKFYAHLSDNPDHLFENMMSEFESRIDQLTEECYTSLGFVYSSDTRTTKINIDTELTLFGH